jgi:serine phosphatase RsbU (regulator of sigma subunit)
MDRGPTAHPLTWLVLPAAALLIASALSLPHQPYTGMVLREDRIVAVIPGGPAAHAGLRPGDRIRPHTVGHDPWESVRSATDMASPGQSLLVERDRGGRRELVWMLPTALPDAERRMMAALLAVASGFVLLGGWVWSERRDRLTGSFFLLSLAFAYLLAPLPRFTPPLTLVHEVIYTAVSLWLPALFVHFFALFPEPRLSRGRTAAGVTTAHGIAATLFVAWLLVLTLRIASHPGYLPALAVLQGTAALWFAAGIVSALVLFVRSYRRAVTPDARRRLRVALAGSMLGLGPVAALIVVHSLAPAASVPGERWAALLTLLVPLSFAWAIAVHGVFDFRVAVRASVAVMGLALIAGAAWFAAESLGAAFWVDRGAGASGATLAVVALAASLAGPARGFGGRMPALETHPPLGAALTGGAGEPRAHDAAELLARACRSVAGALGLDGCTAVVRAGDRIEVVAVAGRPAMGIESGSILATAVEGPSTLFAADDPALAPADRVTLESAGVQWVVPVHGAAAPALLLLGRRLAGPWLGRREIAELERLAAHLAVSLENLALRDRAREHGIFDRELERAAVFQSRLLPRRAPIFPTLDCAAATLSSEPVGGDYYDFVQGTEREFTLVVGDAAGKGVPAALVLAGVQARFRSEANGGRGPSELLAALNRELVERDQPETFVGLLCARVDVRQARLWLANAGLTPPLLRRRSGDCEELTDGGILLGVSGAATYHDETVALAGGDVVVLYTDGLTEARRGEEMFGPERVREVLDAHAHERAGRIVDALIRRVRAFADRPLDDLTVLVLKQLTDPVPRRA